MIVGGSLTGNTILSLISIGLLNATNSQPCQGKWVGIQTAVNIVKNVALCKSLNVVLRIILNFYPDYRVFLSAVLLILFPQP